MTWAPITPSGFVMVPTPTAVRRIIPSRFGAHLFAPLSNAGGPNGLLCLSLEINGFHLHASKVVTQDEIGKDVATLYERVVKPITGALDEHAKKRAA